MIRRHLVIGSSALALVVGLSCLTPTASAVIAASSSLYAISGVGIGNNDVPGNFDLDGQSNSDGSPVSASLTNQTFTGMDSTGATRTLTFSASNHASASFITGLHVYSSGTVTNSYHNAANPAVNDGSGTPNYAGSPDSLYSLGFAGFTDTLQYGGALQAGYKAKYIFHVDGTNTENFPYTAAGMSFGIEGYDDESFFADTGANNTYWVTQSYDINGITPQQVHVQFSTQYVFNTYEHADGDNDSGYSDFSATLTLQAIVVTDANGDPVTDVTVSSGSGTDYTLAPEPASLAVCGLAVLPLLRRRRVNR